MRVYRQSRLLHRLMRRLAATRPMAKVYGVIQQPLDEWVFGRSRGRTTASSWLAGVEIVMLTTTGARTGHTRTVPLLALRDDGDLIAIASNFGRPRHPAWYHNLCANPRASVLLGGETHQVVAHELAGSERKRSFRVGEDVFPGFTHYARWTNRRIPVLRLVVAGSTADDATQVDNATNAEPRSSPSPAYGRDARERVRIRRRQIPAHEQEPMPNPKVGSSPSEPPSGPINLPS